MKRRAFLICIALIWPALASGQSVKLQANEIDALLSGNTAIGTWNGAAYRQFFDPDGVTLYAQRDARTARGDWRVDAERDEYQSIWPREEDWEGWFVMEWNGDFYWVSKSTPPTPFRIEQGQQLDWPNE